MKEALFFEQSKAKYTNFDFAKKENNIFKNFFEE